MAVVFPGKYYLVRPPAFRPLQCANSQRSCGSLVVMRAWLYYALLVGGKLLESSTVQFNGSRSRSPGTNLISRAFSDGHILQTSRQHYTLLTYLYSPLRA